MLRMTVDNEFLVYCCSGDTQSSYLCRGRPWGKPTWDSPTMLKPPLRCVRASICQGPVGRNKEHALSSSCSCPLVPGRSWPSGRGQGACNEHHKHQARITELDSCHAMKMRWQHGPAVILGGGRSVQQGKEERDGMKKTKTCLRNTRCLIHF